MKALLDAIVVGGRVWTFEDGTKYRQLLIVDLSSPMSGKDAFGLEAYPVVCEEEPFKLASTALAHFGGPFVVQLQCRLEKMGKSHKAIVTGFGQGASLSEFTITTAGFLRREQPAVKSAKVA